MAELTPRQTVEELDKYIIGQAGAKRAVAIALRNRYRRSLLPEEVAEEIMPKNIMMMGPTGVGKTEIARRLAKLVKAPFVKVEATKFTEVGYVGRDVESIVRDLVEASIHMVREERINGVSEKAKAAAKERLIDLLMPKEDKPEEKPKPQYPFAALFGPTASGNEPAKTETPEEISVRESTRSAIEMQLDAGLLEDQMVELEVEDKPNMDLSQAGVDINLGEIMGGMMPKKTKIRKISVSEARRVLEQEEGDKLIDREDINGEALKRAETEGIVFLDEIDKIAGRQTTGGGGPDVSREGVQRDILPIVEGSTVNTKYGPVKTDHMLFIAAGAFHVAKVEDLIPELQGRFPIRVTLDSLSVEDFKRILVEPENALTKQYAALLGTEGLQLKFTDDGIDAIAEFAYESNENSENLGARRLQGILEQLLEEVSFEADTMQGEVVIDKEYVESRLKHHMDLAALKKYIL